MNNRVIVADIEGADKRNRNQHDVSKHQQSLDQGHNPTRRAGRDAHGTGVSCDGLDMFSYHRKSAAYDFLLKSLAIDFRSL